MNAGASSLDAIKTYKEISTLHTYCALSHKCGQCPAKGVKIHHNAKVYRSKYKKVKQNNDRSNNQSAKFRGKE